MMVSKPDAIESSSHSLYYVDPDWIVSVMTDHEGRRERGPNRTRKPMPETDYTIRPIGWVESPLVDPDAAPLQGDEGTPDAWLVLDPTMRAAMGDITVGAEIIVFTW